MVRYGKPISTVCNRICLADDDWESPIDAAHVAVVTKVSGTETSTWKGEPESFEAAGDLAAMPRCHWASLIHCNPFFKLQEFEEMCWIPLRPFRHVQAFYIIHVYVCAIIHLQYHICVCISISLYIYISTYLYILSLYIYPSIHLYIYISIYLYVHISIYIHISTYLHIYI